MKKLLLLALTFCNSALLHAEAPSHAPAEFPLTLTDIRVRDPFILPEGGMYYLYAQDGNRANNDNADLGVEVYRSGDLVHWTQPKQVFVRPKEGFWGNPPIWAPEVHKLDGAYYMFATFTGRDAGRGSQILRSESPEGPFVVVGDQANTPAEQGCLDATPWIDPDGTHWMVYAHEWIQIKDGTFLAVKMKNDWSARIGEPILLFHASQGPWVRAHPKADTFVTDGPFFHRMKNGKLVMIWSSFVKGHGYGMGQAISESSTIAGPWRHLEKPFFGGEGEDGGHCMIFRDFSGELLMALHQPNGGNLERAKIFRLKEDGDLLVVDGPWTPKADPAAPSTAQQNAAAKPDPQTVFQIPPESAKPGVWWHWMGSNVTKEGITRDLEEFKRVGIGGATIFGMADVCTPWAAHIENSPTDGLIAFTDPWWEMVRHAAAEGKRLGIDVGLHNCPGYSSTGGPWITPELSMQQIYHSQTPMEGGVAFDGVLPRPNLNPQGEIMHPVVNKKTGALERPVIPARSTYWRDIAVLAVPAEGVIAKDQM